MPSVCLWVLGIFGYLMVGYASGTFALFDYNDDTDTNILPLYRRLLRRIHFPFSSLEGRWGGRTRGDHGEPGQYAQSCRTEEEKYLYICVHTFLWPLFRFFPALIGTLVMGTQALLHFFLLLLIGLMWSIRKTKRLVNGTGQLEYLEGFQEEIASNEAKISAILNEARGRLGRIGDALFEAKEICRGGLLPQVSALTARLDQLYDEQEKRVDSAAKVLEQLTAAKRQIADYNKLLVLYRKTADFTDTSKEQDELFQGSLGVMEIVRRASATFSYVSEKTLVAADIPIEEVEGLIRNNVQREHAVAARQSQILNQLLSNLKVNRIVELRETGHSLSEIVRLTKHASGTVFKYIKNVEILPIHAW